MTPFLDRDGVTIYTGDCRELLESRAIPSDSVHCCVTSPPYWNLRDYGHPDQIGQEPTPEEYVANLARVFRALWHTLRDDATLWLNLGDTYGANKQLLGLPWRVALALQADGWFLRQDIIWHKPSPMPESVTDRCTKAHEYLFLFSKRPHYFFDSVAIQEEASGKKCGNTGPTKAGRTGDKHHRTAANLHNIEASSTRNRRSVWTIATVPNAAAHFATFPPDLVKPCILAATSEGGCCPHCGGPWERIVERTKLTRERPNEFTKRTGQEGTGNSCANTVAGVSVQTLGWQPTCECREHVPVPCTVLDPFMGSGTTAAVAQNAGRRVIGCELNPDYCGLIADRLRQRRLFAGGAE